MVLRLNGLGKVTLSWESTAMKQTGARDREPLSAPCKYEEEFSRQD